MNQIRQCFAQPLLRQRMLAILASITLDRQILVHVVKTVIAACMAAGLATLLELPQPRTAVITVFVLMQPMSGMVLAKSFYRFLGTVFGTLAAIGIAEIFPHSPELYLTAIAVWCALCTGASVRYRHFRWYGWVLAAYTVTLIAIPAPPHPGDIFLVAGARAAEVAVGMLCSTFVSMLIFPLRAGDAFLTTLRKRYADLAKLTSDFLGGTASWQEFDQRFAVVVDGMANLEAARVFATFEGPFMRTRTRRFAKLNDEFAHACSRLHALRQWIRRLENSKSEIVLARLQPHLHVLAQIIGSDTHFALPKDIAPDRVAIRIRGFRSRFIEAIPRDRVAVLDASSAMVVEFDTACEILLRFVAGFIRYALTYESLHRDRHRLEKVSTPYHVTADHYAIGFAALRSLLVVAIAAWFWQVTAWPSGAYAVVGAAMAGPLSSLSTNPAKLTWRMALGTAMSVVVAYIYLYDISPSIKGFPLLCVVLAPTLAIGAYLLALPAAAGFGVGFSVFFAFLAIPGTIVGDTPQLLINDGIALAASMGISALIFATICPPDMPWLTRRSEHTLRRQVSYAALSPLRGLEQRFQSATHDAMSQLGQLHLKSPQRKQAAWRWTLSALEIGYATMDLRRHMLTFDVDDTSTAPCRQTVDLVVRCLAELFAAPNRRHVANATHAVDRSIAELNQTIHDNLAAGRVARIRRVLCCLHFLRAALTDNDSPLNA